MNRKFVSVSSAIVLAMAAASVGAAEKTLQDLEGVSVSLVEAINTAEAHVNGKAYEAEFEKNSFKPEYEVNLLTQDGKHEVTIDAMTGEVTRSKKD